MEFSAKEILCLIERASVIPDILRQKEEIEDLLVKFAAAFTDSHCTQGTVSCV